MTDRERAMRLAVDQLRELRHANEILRARVETMDLLGCFVLAQPPQRGSQGMGEDAAWLLQRELDVMQKIAAEEKQFARAEAPPAQRPEAPYGADNASGVRPAGRGD